MEEQILSEELDVNDVKKMMDTFCYDEEKFDLLMQDTGKRIQEERIKRNLSIYQLASLSNVSSSHINRIENGQRKAGIEPLLKICAALSISVMDVLPIEQPMHLMTNGERFDRITQGCSLKMINFLLDMAANVAKMDNK